MKEEFNKIQEDKILLIEEIKDSDEKKTCRLTVADKSFSFTNMPRSWTPYDLVAYVIRTYSQIEQGGSFEGWCKLGGREVTVISSAQNTYNSLKLQGERLILVLGDDLYRLLARAYWTQYL